MLESLDLNFDGLDPEAKIKAESDVINFLVRITKSFSNVNNEHLKVAEKVLIGHCLEKYNTDNLVSKSDYKAKILRNQGNELFVAKKYNNALVKYNESLCYATPGSANVGLVYANRAAVYLRMNYLKLALENINLARENNYPLDKIKKLDEREEQCLEKQLNGEQDKEDFLKKYEDSWNQIMSPTLPANKKFPNYIADCLSLENFPDQGRYVISNADVRVGTVLMIESPFVATTQMGSHYKYCDNCLKRSHLNLIPCESCVSVMYCSDKCRKEAFEDYHRFVCGSAYILDGFGLDSYSCILRMFCTGLNIFGGPEKFAQFLKDNKDSDVSAWDLDFKGLDEPELQKKMFKAVISMKDRDNFEAGSDYYTNFITLVSFTASLLNYSKLKDILKTEDDQEMFRKFLLKCRLASRLYFAQLSRQDGVSIGCGRFNFTDFLQHSCAPNALMIFFNNKKYLIALRPIKKGDQLSISIIGKTFEFMSIRERKKILKGHADCKCEACKFPRKFPLKIDLPLKDPHFNRFLISIEFNKILQDNNLEAALSHFRTICRYIDEHDAKNFPCQEIANCCTMIQKCIGIFGTIDDFDEE